MLLMKAKKPTYFIAVVIILIIIFWLKLGGINKPGNSITEVTTLLASSKPQPIEQPATSDGQRVKISIFYETLCPDSIGFIVRQLWPAYNTIGSIMDIDLVPYGKASYTPNGDTWNFQCQHGKRECHGNKIHSCVLDMYPSISQWMPFVFCSMSSSDPVSGSEICASKNSLDWQKISACADGKLGSQLLKANGVRTESLSPRLVFVPWILVNNEYSDAQLETALDNLPLVVCNAYKGSKPSGCAA